MHLLYTYWNLHLIYDYICKRIFMQASVLKSRSLKTLSENLFIIVALKETSTIESTQRIVHAIIATPWWPHHNGHTFLIRSGWIAGRTWSCWTSTPLCWIFDTIKRLSAFVDKEKYTKIAIVFPPPLLNIWWAEQRNQKKLQEKNDWPCMLIRWFLLHSYAIYRLLYVHFFISCDRV